MNLNVKEPHVYVIGTGGTGGFVVDMLSRMVFGTTTTLTLVDGDVVEHKNLSRQSFQHTDLGKNKAEAKLDHLRTIFGDVSNINVIPEYVSSVDELLAMLLTGDTERTPIIISAVDNVATRRIINQAINEYPMLAVGIDAGNHDTGGQVVLFANQPVTVGDFIRSTSGMLPNMLELFPEMNNIQDTVPGAGTACEDHAESDPQSMMANVLNATVISTVVQSLIANHAVGHNLWRTDAYTGQIQAYQTLL